MPAPHVYYSVPLDSWVLGDDWETGINGAILRIPAGYQYDMASVPWFLQWWIQKYKLGTAAPLIHDWGYQHGGDMGSVPPVQWKRKEVDRKFLDAMRCEGVRWFKRGAAYRGVRWFGWFAWRRKGSPDQRR